MENFYTLLRQQLQTLTENVPYKTANLANAAALLNMTLDDINWVGFYLAEGDRLILGPFQGKPACIQIPIGQGVCGTAAAKNQIQLVPNVHEFAGHIACDSASNSEIVLPLCVNGQVAAVLDIDSPTLGRFTAADRDGLAQLVPIFEKILR